MSVEKAGPAGVITEVIKQLRAEIRTNAVPQPSGEVDWAKLQGIVDNLEAAFRLVTVDKAGRDAVDHGLVEGDSEVRPPDGN